MSRKTMPQRMRRRAFRKPQPPARTLHRAADEGRRQRSPSRAPEKRLVLCHCPGRSEEHTSELQSLMRTSYAVFCLKKKKMNNNCTITVQTINTHTVIDNIIHTTLNGDN